MSDGSNRIISEQAYVKLMVQRLSATLRVVNLRDAYAGFASVNDSWDYVNYIQFRVTMNGFGVNNQQACDTAYDIVWLDF